MTFDSIAADAPAVYATVRGDCREQKQACLPAQRVAADSSRATASRHTVGRAVTQPDRASESRRFPPDSPGIRGQLCGERTGQRRGERGQEVRLWQEW